MVRRRWERLLWEEVWEEISPVVETRAVMAFIGTEVRLLTALVSVLLSTSSLATGTATGRMPTGVLDLRSVQRRPMGGDR